MDDTIVIGGGIVGASAAYHLARAGVDVLLIDRDDEGRATDAGAGIVSPETSGYESDAMHAFAIDAARYYPDLVADLEAETGRDTGYARCGTLSVVVSPDERAAFETSRAMTLERRDEYDYPSAESLRDVTPDEATDLFPALGDVEEAFYYEDGARVDGGRMNEALSAAAEAEGAAILDASAEEIETGAGAVSGVLADGDRYEADRVVVSGGAWSPAFGDDLGIEVPVAPQRGQIAHFDLPGHDTGDWPIVRAFREHYLVPWADDRIAAGATRETGAGFDPRTTVAGVEEVLSEALRVAPGLADAELREVRVGLRPLSDDGLPVIGAAPGVEGAYLATGHGPLGLTLGPYTGAIVADLLVEGEARSDVSAFSPERFEG